MTLNSSTSASVSPLIYVKFATRSETRLTKIETTEERNQDDLGYDTHSGNAEALRSSLWTVIERSPKLLHVF